MESGLGMWSSSGLAYQRYVGLAPAWMFSLSWLGPMVPLQWLLETIVMPGN